MHKSRAGCGSMSERLLVLAALLAFVAPSAALEPIHADGFEQTAPVPMPVLSRLRPATASSGFAAAAVDGEYFGGATWDVFPSAQNPAWVAIDVGAGPTRAILSWVAYPGSSLPVSYRLETSANSTDGNNGAWTTAVTVSANALPSRAHALDFAGQRWLRFIATTAEIPANGIRINEIDVHDASLGTSDTWMFVGDSITGAAFSRSLFADNFP